LEKLTIKERIPQHQHHNKPQSHNKRDILSSYCFGETCVPVNSVCFPGASSTCGVCYDTNFIGCLDNSKNNSDLCNCYSTLKSCVAPYEYCDEIALGGYETCVEASFGCCGPLPTGLTVPNCNFGSWCDFGNTGNCLALHKTGSCSSSTECGDPANTNLLDSSFYSCVNAQCTYSPGFLPGQACQQNSDCITNVCTNSVCVGSTAGQSCTTTSCYDGFYCNNRSVCAAQSGLGGPCVFNPSDSSTDCLFGYYCSKENVCANLFSKSVGTECSEAEECNLGLTCFNNECANPAPVKTCVNNTNCQGDSRYTGECECDTLLEENICNPVATINAPAACSSQTSAVIACVQNNNCGNTLDCCTAELDCYYNCIFTQEGFETFDCGGIPTCSTSTSGSAATSGSVSGGSTAHITAGSGSTSHSTTSQGVVVTASVYLLTLVFAALLFIN